MSKINEGLSSTEVILQREKFGTNVISTHKIKAYQVLFRQLNNPILWLLIGALVVSGVLGNLSNSLMIGAILLLSIGLGFVTEYRAQKATEDLHSRIKRHATVIRDGVSRSIEISELVPGDIVQLRIGSVIPADLKLLEVSGLECDESLITGESLPVAKSIEENKDGSNRALMGTIVRLGTATGEVIATGGYTEFGKIAKALGNRPPQTNFQIGLRDFSLFLLRIALVIIAVVIVGNIWLKRPVIETVLYAFSLAVGLTPQLLPAIVSTALAMGSRKLAHNGVLIKRLVSIEDLGDIDILLTDKTGTLTSGEVNFEESYPIGSSNPVVAGLLATEADYVQAVKSGAGLSQLDSALWTAKKLELPVDVKKLDFIPFDHERRMTSALVTMENKKYLFVKGSPEDVLAKSKPILEAGRSLLNSLYEQGARVIAVATKEVVGKEKISTSDENDLEVIGFLTFSDPPKIDARESLEHLAELGIQVKVATGDSLEVCRHVCEKVGLKVEGTLTGVEISKLTDEELIKVVLTTTIFARVSPEQKARILAALRNQGKSIAFLGDGVNDAIALHDADVGISVDSATDVAKDAADVVLLEKDLGVLANGIRQGRLVFNNTMKYIFMAVSADFGNMFSASIGSLILPFLPMLPMQVLLQDLAYDTSQLAIPGDNVDREQVAKPSHWNIGQIRKFMWVFGLASSIFDFLTFGLLIWILHAKESEFHTGWFIESLATATLVVLVIRTRRVPFFKSTPSKTLLFALIGINLFAFALTITPLAKNFGFVALPINFYIALAIMIFLYLTLVEFAKRRLFSANNYSKSP